MTSPSRSFARVDAGPVALLREGPVSPGKFAAEIHALATLLPDRPYVVNFCASRYRFAVAWAAAMLRGQVMLLPASRDRAAVAALQPDFPDLYLLGDDDETRGMGDAHFAFPPLPASLPEATMPAFPPDQIGAVLFTSGSTGRPQPSIRRWGRLVAASDAAAAALGIHKLAGAPLIATVPHGHSYGLESAVVLPLRHGLLLTPDRPFFPADIRAALSDAARPAMLVTTPVHLQALTQDEDPGATAHASLVLSATAPLTDACAAAAETVFGAPVFEIYGCSEAGQLATRRTLDGPVWRCLEGFRLYHDQAGCWAAGPHEPDVLLGDRIEPAEEGSPGSFDGSFVGGFVLKGRNADLVNVAGKRSSLAYLTGELTAIEGVEDGVFLNPETDPSATTARLAALAVAPGLDAATIIAHLRQRVDPAFLPRPLRLVGQLPRNALGKLPREVLLALLTAPNQAARPASTLRLSIPTDLPAAQGHFPGNPIVPGAVLLDHVVAAIASPGWRGTVDAAKFHHPVRPGDTLEIAHRAEDAGTRFECRIAGSRVLVLSGALRSSFPPP